MIHIKRILIGLGAFSVGLFPFAVCIGIAHYIDPKYTLFGAIAPFILLVLWGMGETFE